jgi:peptidoglycan/LPS O-acetylase OafA/YrhL
VNLDAQRTGVPGGDDARWRGGDGPKRVYRPDIDGLRAVAVMAVVVFHAFPAVLSGGFIGVDVFFVISGFLISGIIRGELEQGAFSLRGFYRRRIHRLFPALVVVLATCLAGGILVMVADEYRGLGRATVFGTLFAENVNLWLQAGYFDSTAWEKPLRHLWSLSLEEQFYLAYPLAMMMAWRFPRAVTPLIGVACVASLALNLWAIDENATLTFLAPATRAWELLAGGLVAAMPTLRGGAASPWRSRGADLAAGSGLGLIVLAAWLYDPGFPYPGMRAVVPVAGAVLVIAAGPAALSNRFLLGNPLMVSLGLISYPLYLWHWPALSFAHILTYADPPVLVRAIMVIASMLAAAATYSFLERPLRRSPSTLVTSGLIGASLAITAAGALIAGGAIRPAYDESRYDAEIAAAVSDFGFQAGDSPAFDFQGALVHGVAGGDGPRTLYWGDSHMQQYFPRLFALIRNQPAHGRGVEFLAYPGLPPILDPTRRECMDNVARFRSLAGDPRVDTVVIAAAWEQYLVTDDPTAKEFAGFAPIVAELTRAGKTVYIVLDTPSGRQMDPKYIFGRGWSRHEAGIRAEGLSSGEVLARQRPGRTLLIALARTCGARIIDPLPFLLHGNRFPAVTADGHAIYKDTNHLRASWVRTEVRFLDQTLEGPHGLPPGDVMSP